MISTHPASRAVRRPARCEISQRHWMVQGSGPVPESGAGLEKCRIEQLGTSGRSVGGLVVGIAPERICRMTEPMTPPWVTMAVTLG